MTAFLHPFAPPTRSDFVTIVSGERSYVTDDQGNRYIDAMAGLWYNAVGHGHLRMIEAISQQVAKLATFHTFGTFTNEPAEQLSQEIVDHSPFQDGRVFLTSSGSESVDSAIKIARMTQHLRGEPQRQRVISREHGYHGVTMGGTSAQGIIVNQDGFGTLLGGFEALPHNDLEAMSMLFAEHGTEIAAVITEPIQGVGGVNPPQDGYLEGLRRLCDQHGALLIFDEAICGFGRLGSWFGAEHYDIKPDLITGARRIGDRLDTGLSSLRKDGILHEVRGQGAVWAADLGPQGDSAGVFAAMQRHGVIARPLGTSIAFCPPLITTDSQIDQCVDALASAITELA